MKSKLRPHTEIECLRCGEKMLVRNDYIKKHLGLCMSCQSTGNNNAKKHGEYKRRLYHIWVGLKHRRYSYIPEICEKWSSYDEFKKWAEENGYRKDLTIDRVNPRRGYFPGNCQWITRELNAGKDKQILTSAEKVDVSNARKKMGMTQIEMAAFLGVSRNTIQRADKFTKGEKK